ncbi:thioredoxin TrxC [Oxalobacteraceae bacterium OM1]|nr:thioredoxin TrxC [Oxalobacteraceae bacterium OM1]
MSLHIVCPHCQATNRVPEERLRERPDCGRCHQPLFGAKPVTLSTETFQAHVARNDIPVLVDFWAPWCGPCRMMAPAFEAAAAKLEPEFRVAKLNTEEAQDIALTYQIRSIPTLALFVRGREFARQTGAMGMADIIGWARSQAARVRQGAR